MLIKLFLGELLIFISNRIIAYIPIHNIRLYFYKFVMKFDIGKNSSISMGAWFDSRKNFSIGQNSTINQNCRLDTRGVIKIGDNVSISADVCILTADHDLLDHQFKGRTSPVVIEDYVFIGTRAIILRGVTLGKGSAVAAGSVVTKDVSPFSIVAGVPAQNIGHRPQTLNYNCHYSRLFH
ncbi:acyltransferase [Halotia wernerae UHCC 0503]|nr:acyltransferase [Halotia wernerae UHCC 0503]